jgi:hypothetical protein
MPHLPHSRWTAVALHAAASLVLITAIAACIVLRWYPGGLWQAADLHALLGLMLVVHVVLGPLLTLIIYRPGKRGLGFDLAVIALAQAAALAYGAYVTWINRPAFLVGSERGFGVVFASELPPSALRAAQARDWPRFRGHGPWIVGLDLSGEESREAFMFAFALGGTGPLRDPERYRPLAEFAPAIIDKAQAVPQRIEMTSAERSETRAMVLLSARSAPAIVLLDATSGQPTRIAR